MTTISGGSNYISDGDIMTWLAQQQDRVYGDLRQSMDLAETRADCAEALNQIKSHLSDANRNHDFKQVDAELQAFMAKYGGQPEFADTCKTVSEIAGKIHTDYVNVEANKLQHRAQAAYVVNSAGAGLNNALGVNPTPMPTPPALATLPPPVNHYDDKQIESWSGLIDGSLDHSSKNDQLTMIHIQELKATLDQGAQLGSSFIASGDKTSNSIIHNIA
jgi:hypothetical protein